MRFFTQILSRRYAFTLFYVLICVTGWLSFRHLAVEQMPNVQLPSLTANYSWGRTSPEVMEQEITRSLEQTATRLRGVQSITSRSAEGSSSVTVTFQKNVNVDLVQLEWLEYLKVLDQSFPIEVRRGVMSRSVPEEVEGLQTFITYSLYGPYSAFFLKDEAERHIKLPLSGLDGLDKITITGVTEPVLTVSYSASQWSRLGISPNQVISELRERFKWMGSGSISIQGEQFSIVSKPLEANLDSIRAYPVMVNKNLSKPLGEIAFVEIEDYPQRFIRRINGNTALSINFVKESGADAIGLAEEIHSRMTKMASLLPKDSELRLQQDATEEIRKEIDSLADQSLFSVGFVFLLLLLVIRRIQSPIIIITNILFSLLIAMTGLYLVGQSLNTFTMAALTISIGMLVDNAIVVYDHLEKHIAGKSVLLRNAIIASEMKAVLVPVLGNTLTTIGIFLPLIYSIPSLRYFLEPFGLALGFALIGSVIISLTWMPFLFQWLRLSKRKKLLNISGLLRRWLYHFWYWRHRLRWIIMVLLLYTIGLPFYLIPEYEPVAGTEIETSKIGEVWNEYRPFLMKYLGGVGAIFFNDVSFSEPWQRRESESIYVSISTPIGTPLEELDKIAKVFERVAEPYKKYMLYYETILNERTGARLIFYFDKESVFIPHPYVLKGELMYLAARTGNSIISVSGFGQGFSTGGFSSGGNMRLEITGSNYDQLAEVARDIRNRLNKNRRVRDIDINDSNSWNRSDLFHYTLDIDDHKLMQKGMTKPELIYLLRDDIQPEAFAGRISFGGKPIFLKTENRDASTLKDDFMNAMRFSTKQTGFRLSELVDLEREKTMTTITRENQLYSRIISFEYLGSFLNGRDYQNSFVEMYPVPVGVTIQVPNFWARFNIDKSEENQQRWYLLFGSVFVVFLILAGFLNNFGQALKIIGYVLLGFLGVAILAIYWDLMFGRGAYAGSLLLGGVIVNNGLLLFHQSNRFSKDYGMIGYRNYYWTLKAKLRSVWLTTLTTIAGLMPLLIWSSDSFWSSLAFVVISGMTFSTLMISLLWRE